LLAKLDYTQTQTDRTEYIISRNEGDVYRSLKSNEVKHREMRNALNK